MLSPSDVILLLEKWTRRTFAVDIRKTDIGDDFMTQYTTTDKVRHITEMDVSTDVCLDSMTVQAQTPPTNVVNIIPGRVQWFNQLIEFTDTVESPVLPPFTTADCDPMITEPVRWSLLCLRQDTTGNDVLFWEHGTPGKGYPEVPNLGVPLALVKTTVGVVQIEQSDIINWRSIRPGYAPGAKFQYPPVEEVEDLYNYQDPVEGAQCLVMSTGYSYYYQNGDWHTVGLPSFDNTAWSVDLTEAKTRIDLPWTVKSRVELIVFRDGQLMLLDRDYRTMVGPASYLQFNHLLLPGQRIVVMRNPFMAEAFAGDNSSFSGIESIDIYVDGDIGNDSWEGSQSSPFKTLQRAFDFIPIYAMKIYTVHARNLRAEDIVTTPNSDEPVYGYAIGKNVVTLMLDIDDSYDHTSGLTAVASLQNCSYVVFGAGDIKYRLDLVDCLSGFMDSNITESVVVWGGYTTMHNVTAVNTETTKVIFSSGASAKLSKSTFHHISVTYSSHVRFSNCTVYSLYGSNQGIVQMLYGFLNDKVEFTDSSLFMSATTIRAEGSFVGSYVGATGCTNVGSSAYTLAPLFFNGLHGTTMRLVSTQISYIDGCGISLKHNCTLFMQEGSIFACKKDGIDVEYTSSASLREVRLANNGASGVRGDYGSTIEFKSCFGGDNNRWGCECYNLSMATFGTLGVWGNLGGYYMQSPGSNTVVSELGLDLVPGALVDKVVPGRGLKSYVHLGSNPNDYKFHIDIDPSTLAGPGSSYVINTNARQNVVTRYSPITMAAPDTDVNIRWAGTSYMSSVCQRVYDPTTRSKSILTNLANRIEFTEMDDAVGTDFLSNRVTLHEDPLLGYPVNSPYYFASNPDGTGVLPIYGTQEVSDFDLVADAPPGTEIHVAFSNNGAGLWKTWNPSLMSWNELPGDSTLIQMQNAPLHTSVATWNPACWELLRQLGGRAICVCFLLVSTSSALTPSVYSYTWKYVEDGFLLDITHAFSRKYFNNRAIFSYDGSLGPQIDPPIVFSVMPTADRES